MLGKLQEKSVEEVYEFFNNVSYNEWKRIQALVDGYYDIQVGRFKRDLKLTDLETLELASS